VTAVLVRHWTTFAWVALVSVLFIAVRMVCG